MNLFEIIASFFSKNYKNVTNIEKSKNGFMINRFCSIYYPVHSALLSRVKINTGKVVDFWKYTLNKKYTSTPQWMYSKKNKVKKEEILDEKLIKEYCRINKCSLKDFNEILNHYPKELKKELNELKKYLDL